MNRRRQTIRRTTQHSRAGFTLTEMLVATALVVLIMLMFAQIYASAISSITDQRALANNDQKARNLSSIIRNDLEAMTYRQPQPPYGDVAGLVAMVAGDDGLIDPENQRGYFYYSENDVDNQTDDVLQFTVWSDGGVRQQRYTGRAGDLDDDLSNRTVFNQPLSDDGDFTNSAGVSRAAEVSYFLRNGNLHRRVLLLRDPVAAVPPRSAQPGNISGFQKYGTSNRNYSNNSGEFLRDFDYSATRFFNDPSNASDTGYLWFNSIESLLNDQGIRNNPIALPWNRFGHFNDLVNNPINFPMDPAAGLDHGQPREYTDEVPGDGVFMGRFTHEETSHDEYDYPGIYSLPGRPGDPNRRSRQLPKLDSDGVVPDFKFGTRVGEDILLTRVTEFNVEVFDPLADVNNDGISGPAGYADLGHRLPQTATLGSKQLEPVFGQAQRDRTSYGPRTGGNRVFDSWHPDIRRYNTEPRAITDTNPDPADVAPAAPPFRPLHTEAKYPGTGANSRYVRFFNGWGALPTAIGDSAAPRGSPDNLPNAQRTILIPDGWNSTLAFEWRGGDLPGTTEPEWPRSIGATVTDGDITWECIDNRIGLQAIRITVRFFDQQSGLPRQLSLVHSFIE